MPRIGSFLIALLLTCTLPWACKETEPEPDPPGPPLGMILVEDGVTYAGVAVVDITPEVVETFTDLNGDGSFDGCLDDPAATGNCVEPFDDVDGDGWFDAIFIGGFGPMRPANGVHDPITMRTLVLAHDGEYIALVVGDLVGLQFPRVHGARDALVADGFDKDRMIYQSTHNHQGPDTMGLWGNPINFADPTSGIIPEYQQRVQDAIEQSVRDAAASMVPVTMKVGALHTRDLDPYFNGPVFGGKSPDTRQHGMVHDGRDPVVVSDQMLVMQGTGDDGDVVFTWTNWSGHPETFDSENNLISSDFAGVLREVLEAEYGGTAIHTPECLGGMQSALSGEMPLVSEDGTHQFQTCDAEAVANPKDAECYGKAVGDPRIDADGDPVPVWAEGATWDFVRSHGWHLAEAAMIAIETGEAMEATPIRATAESMYIPIENTTYQLMGPLGLFEVDLTDAIEDSALCPEAAGTDIGCIEMRTFRAQIGPVGFVGAPGEILPELAWGFPDEDPRWPTEADDPAARGPDSAYFPQHDADCNALDYEDCRSEREIGDCNCIKCHAWPYLISYDPAVMPFLDHLDTEYRAALSMTDDYWSYVVPEPDFNTWVSLIGPDDGDHYEDTVSPGQKFATRVQEAQQRIDERW